MTSGILSALAFGAIAVAVVYGLLRRQRGGRRGAGETNTVAQWTEGETTRLLSSAELPGLYLLRPRFLSKAEHVLYLPLTAAFPRPALSARARPPTGPPAHPGPTARVRARAVVGAQHGAATAVDKLGYSLMEPTGGRVGSRTCDGTNDAPARAQGEVGVAMNSGTSAAKEAGNMVDLDSNPTKLIEIVEIGKQLLITRGSLTTFSIANDIAKYFAIIPAMFAGVFVGLGTLNIMRLSSPESAILSAVIFNALIIIGLIPLALRGVRYTPSSAASMLRRNLAIYGLGGIISPFIGIKLIDLLVSQIPGIR